MALGQLLRNISWQYLMKAYESWEWLRDVFECESTYHISLVAYYMALKIHERAAKIAFNSEANLNPQYLNIPLDFLFIEEYEIKRSATSSLLQNPAVSELWECEDVSLEQMKNSWEMSIEQYGSQILHFYDQSYLRFLAEIPPEYLNFFDAL